VELSPFLLIAALLVFLLEVLERRTGVLGGQRLRQAPEPAPAAKRPGVKLKKTARSATPKPAATSGPATERATAPASSAPEEEPKKTMFDALRQARSRAQKRNR
jgi:hypothetical protein